MHSTLSAKFNWNRSITSGNIFIKDLSQPFGNNIEHYCFVVLFSYIRFCERVGFNVLRNSSQFWWRICSELVCANFGSREGVKECQFIPGVAAYGSSITPTPPDTACPSFDTTFTRAAQGDKSVSCWVGQGDECGESWTLSTAIVPVRYLVCG